MQKSFYYLVPLPEIGYIKEALSVMEIPFIIEQTSDYLHLPQGHVAFVFPDLHVRMYHYVHELFDCHGKQYPKYFC